MFFDKVMTESSSLVLPGSRTRCGAEHPPGSAPYLIDVGAGVVRRAAAAVLFKGLKALDVVNIKTVFVTHLHPDHMVGYPDYVVSSQPSRFKTTPRHHSAVNSLTQSPPSPKNNAAS